MSIFVAHTPGHERDRAGMSSLMETDVVSSPQRQWKMTSWKCARTTLRASLPTTCTSCSWWPGEQAWRGVPGWGRAPHRCVFSPGWALLTSPALDWLRCSGAPGLSGCKAAALACPHSVSVPIPGFCLSALVRRRCPGSGGCGPSSWSRSGGTGFSSRNV